MARKKIYRCEICGYETDVYEGKGLFGQHITAVICRSCRNVENIVVGGVIGDVAPSFRSEVGRLCPRCGSDDITVWDKMTCPRCGGHMTAAGKETFWT